jgi:hypothetical protein
MSGESHSQYTLNNTGSIAERGRIDKGAGSGHDAATCKRPSALKKEALLTDASNFKKSALAFALVYLASQALFAIHDAVATPDDTGCGCLAHMLFFLGWPALAIGTIGLLVTAVLWRMKASGDGCPVLPTLFFLVPTSFLGWAGVCMATGVMITTSTAAAWSADIAIAAAALLSLGLIVSILKDRRKGALPTARLVK